MVIYHYWNINWKTINGHGSGIPRNIKFLSALYPGPYHSSIALLEHRKFFSVFHSKSRFSFSRFHVLFSSFHGWSLEFSPCSTPHSKSRAISSFCQGFLTIPLPIGHRNRLQARKKMRQGALVFLIIPLPCPPIAQSGRSQ
jgi:hypothetical protein